MNISENRKREIIAQEAADWFVANREDQSQTAEQQGDFADWLKASPVHVEEYLGFAQLASDLRKAVVEPELSIDALIERARAAEDTPETIGARIARPLRSVVHHRWAYAAAATLFLAVGLAFFWSSAMRRGPLPAAVAELRFTTQHGEQLTRNLADSSVLHLNTDTSVTVRFDRASRWITIERGQVVFEVAHDAKRPFRVIAGSGGTSQRRLDREPGPCGDRTRRDERIDIGRRRAAGPGPRWGTAVTPLTGRHATRDGVVAARNRI
jgi:transmembrane sensor